jgi:hypothetical protein
MTLNFENNHMNIGKEIGKKFVWQLKEVKIIILTPEPILYLKPLNRGDRYFYSSVSKRRISLKNEIL